MSSTLSGIGFSIVKRAAATMSSLSFGGNVTFERMATEDELRDHARLSCNHRTPSLCPTLISRRAAAAAVAAVAADADEDTAEARCVRRAAGMRG